MNKHRIILSSFVAAVLTVCCMLPGVQRTAAQRERSGGLAIIVGGGSSEREISMPMLRRIFRGEPTDFGGRRLLPFNYAPDTPLRNALDRKVLGLSPDQVGAYWIDRRIRGEGLPPRTVPSPLIMKAIIAKLPGAIGYIPAELVDHTVTVLNVDNKGLNSPDYPLGLD